jgi:DNA modification methylase
MKNYQILYLKNMIEINKIYNGDCLEVMKNIDDKSIDLVITDPPYGTLQSRNASQQVNRMKGDRSEKWEQNNSWDLLIGENEFQWVDECDRTLRNGGTFISYYDRDRINFLSAYLKNKGYKLRNYVVDILTNPVPRGGQLSWCNSVGILGIWVKQWNKGERRFTYNGAKIGQHKEHFIYEEFEEETSGMVLRPILHGKERLRDQGKAIHPTQKPIQIMRDLIEYFSDENDLILDPFSGTGTTCVVAKSLNRNFIGIEINEDYYNLSLNRLLASSLF